MNEIGLLMSTRDHASMLERCIDRVDAQYRRPDRYYVINDGSSDETEEVLDWWLDGKDAWVSHRPPHGHDMVGMHAGLMEGYDLLFSRGCTRVMLIGDDIMMPPEAVGKMSGSMERDGVFYASGVIEGRSDGLIDGYSMLDWQLYDMCRDLILHPYYHHSVFLRRAQMLDAARVYPEITAREERMRGFAYDGHLWEYRGITHRYMGHSLRFAVLKSLKVGNVWGAKMGMSYMRGYMAHVTVPPAMDPIRRHVRRVEFDR